MSTKFVASGDCFITRSIPENGYPGFKEIKELIETADVRFTNLEMTFHDQGRDIRQLRAAVHGPWQLQN